MDRHLGQVARSLALLRAAGADVPTSLAAVTQEHVRTAVWLPLSAAADAAAVDATLSLSAALRTRAVSPRFPAVFLEALAAAEAAGPPAPSDRAEGLSEVVVLQRLGELYTARGEAEARRWRTRGVVAAAAVVALLWWRRR